MGAQQHACPHTQPSSDVKARTPEDAVAWMRSPPRTEGETQPDLEPIFERCSEIVESGPNARRKTT